MRLRPTSLKRPLNSGRVFVVTGLIRKRNWVSKKRICDLRKELQEALSGFSVFLCSPLRLLQPFTPLSSNHDQGAWTLACTFTPLPPLSASSHPQLQLPLVQALSGDSAPTAQFLSACSPTSDVLDPGLVLDTDQI